ncbi:hypothetical protein ACFYYY_22665 [Streptomyces sp. NPDC001834]|uniref:hypothetical protein n=1 Tax=Streptomyces sp. NPDC001834 TaxID=3364616 RepID=UPI0036CC5356
MARSYHRSFGLDVSLTRCTDDYGPYQHPEKLNPAVHHPSPIPRAHRLVKEGRTPGSVTGIR